MSESIEIYMPIPSIPPLISLRGITSVHNLLGAIWEKLKQEFKKELLSHTSLTNMMFSRLSVRALVK